MAGVRNLTKEQREEIVALYAQWGKTKEIAQAYGIDQGDVSHLANGADEKACRVRDGKRARPIPDGYRGAV